MKKQNFLLLIISAIISLLILELSLRFGIVKNPYHDEMTCAGELTNPRYKVLVLGDSLGGAIHKFLLDKLKPFKVKLLNTSGAGFGPFEYGFQMENKGMSFKPDITVLCYYIGNDLTDVERSPINKAGLKNSVHSFIETMLRRTHIYNYYLHKKNLWFPYFFDYKAYAAAGMSPDLVNLAKEGKINPWLLEFSFKNSDFLLDNILLEDKDTLMVWEKSKLLLSKIQDLSRKVGSQFVIVIFPCTVQINKAKYAFYRDLKFNIDERLLSSDRPQKLLKDFCQEKNIPHLDLLPYFKAAQAVELYADNDDHLNDAGNELASKIIIEFLKKSTSLK